MFPDVNFFDCALKNSALFIPIRLSTTTAELKDLAFAHCTNLSCHHSARGRSRNVASLCAWIA